MTRVIAPDVPVRVARAFAAFDEAGLRWSLLRPRESLSQPEGDIDVLVAPADRDRARRLLIAQGFVALERPGPDVHAADLDAASDRFVWIHVQTEVRLGSAVLTAAELLDHAVGAPLPQPADPWLLWLLLMRGLLEKGGVAARHRPFVASAARAAGGGAPSPFASIAAAHGLVPEQVLKLAAEEDWESLAGLARRPTPAVRTPVRRLARAVRRLGGLKRRSGVSVAVIGPDGAGKSTLVETLRVTLPLPVRVQYMGLTGGRMPRADALRLPGVVLAARLAIIWARYLSASLHRRRGEIVVFDRYTLDGAVPPGVRVGTLGALSRRIQRHACPMPDLVLFLDASGRTMHVRSREYDAATLESWRIAFGRLRGSVSNLQVLDAEQPAEVVRRRATELIWQCYRRRHGAVAVPEEPHARV
jgi:thymidylate kinase